jgi:excisionase family DNA binding protein
MDRVEFVGRAACAKSDGLGGTYDDTPVYRKTELSLSEAADLSNLPVDTLKRAIRAGELRAERRGWWRIDRGDLNVYLHRL